MSALDLTSNRQPVPGIPGAELAMEPAAGGSRASVYIDGKWVGGCDADTAEAAAAGGLDVLALVLRGRRRMDDREVALRLWEELGGGQRGAELPREGN